MCEVQIRVGAGCQSGLFKSAVKHIHQPVVDSPQTVRQVSCTW